MGEGTILIQRLRRIHVVADDAIVVFSGINPGVGLWLKPLPFTQVQILALSGGQLVLCTASSRLKPTRQIGMFDTQDLTLEDSGHAYDRGVLGPHSLWVHRRDRAVLASWLREDADPAP